jgi:hypothetical protein
MAAPCIIAVWVSSWARIADTIIPPRIKCAANYQNGRLAMLEAKTNGYDDALILHARGKLSEATGSCCFVARRGIPTTPPVTADILESITRATLLGLFSRKLGLETDVHEIDRTELYIAEEAFLCGSGWRLRPYFPSTDWQLATASNPDRSHRRSNGAISMQCAAKTLLIRNGSRPSEAGNHHRLHGVLDGLTPAEYPSVVCSATRRLICPEPAWTPHIELTRWTTIHRVLISPTPVGSRLRSAGAC